MNNFITFNNFINTYFFVFFRQMNFSSISLLTFYHSDAFFSFSINFSSFKIVIKCSWPIPLFISASDILLSMLLDLLLENMTTLLRSFFLLRVFFNSFFYRTADIENARVKFALAIRTGASITVANNAIEMLPLVADKTIKDLPK